MIEILKFMTSGFWIFLGCVIIIGIPLNFIYKIYARTLRHYSLIKNGYPPQHCDADGDLVDNSKDEKED